MSQRLWVNCAPVPQRSASSVKPPLVAFPHNRTIPCVQYFLDNLLAFGHKRQHLIMAGLLKVLQALGLVALIAVLCLLVMILYELRPTLETTLRDTHITVL